MNRCLSGAFLVAIGIVIGSLLGSLRQDVALAAPRPVADNPNAEVVAQLKELTAETRDINAFLRSGKLRAITVINPNAQ